jgi:hypothetical protein
MASLRIWSKRKTPCRVDDRAIGSIDPACRAIEGPVGAGPIGIFVRIAARRASRLGQCVLRIQRIPTNLSSKSQSGSSDIDHRPSQIASDRTAELDNRIPERKAIEMSRRLLAAALLLPLIVPARPAGAQEEPVQELLLTVLPYVEAGGSIQLSVRGARADGAESIEGGIEVGIGRGLQLGFELPAANCRRPGP